MELEKPPASHFASEDRARVERAVDRGIARYLESRKARIPGFVDRHFSFRGAFRLHRKTLKHDYYKLPLNLLWALPAFVLQHSGAALEKLGEKRLSRLLSKVPAGVRTECQKEIEWLIQTELLELPYSADDRSSTRDALLEAILDDPELAEQFAVYLAVIERNMHTPGFREALESHLSEYGKSRLAVSEAASNLINLAAGLAAAKQATPGALSAGSAIAGAIAQQVAIGNFWLGPTLGAWYYGIFPASASVGLIAATTGALMAATGVLAALSLVILDPLLAKAGFHRRRLERFVQALGDELTGKAPARYRVKDHYYARVLDLMDVLKLAAKTAARL